MHTDIVERKNTIDRLFAQADSLQKNEKVDEEVKSGFVSYLCVRCYVYVEFAVQTILKEYVNTVTHDDAIVNFVQEQLRINRALRRSELLSLIGRFSEVWRKNLRETTKGKLGDSLDSIVNNRNKIAHGDDVYISLSNLHTYFGDAQRIVELVQDECDPSKVQI